MKKSKRDGRVPFVALSWDIIDCAAFKSLSPAAVWLLVQIKRQWTTKGGSRRLVLPFGHVSHRLTWRVFKAAREELVGAGFIDIIQSGGLDHPNIYGESERWRRVSEELLKDESAGRVVWRRIGAERVSVWLPKKKPRRNDNIVTFNTGKARRRPGRPSKAELAARIAQPAPAPLPQLSMTAVRRYSRRLKAGEDAASLADEIRSAGFDVPLGLMRRSN